MSNTVWNNPERRRKARRLLKEWLPRVRADLRAGRYADFEAKMLTGIGTSQAPYLRISNIEGIFVYQTAPGAWYFDIVLKDTPTGVADVIGTPVDQPLPTRAKAESIAKLMLAQAILREDDPAPAAPTATFDYFDFELTLPVELIEQLRALNHGIGTAWTPELAYARLAEITAAYFPDGATKAAIDALVPEKRKHLYAVLAAALTAGVFRYPRRELTEPVLDENSPLSKLH